MDISIIISAGGETVSVEISDVSPGDTPVTGTARMLEHVTRTALELWEGRVGPTPDFGLQMAAAAPDEAEQELPEPVQDVGIPLPRTEDSGPLRDWA